MANIRLPIPLPTIQDLYSDIGWAAKQNDLNRLLNQEPAKGWIKEHPFNKGLKYLPIERVEWLLTNVFLRWWCEVKEIKVVANSVVVTVSVYVIDPITGETIFNDGVAGVDIQTAKGANATDFSQITPFAVMKAVPAAKSYAIKDAAESFGRLFGKDLNRKDFIAYTDLDGKFDFEQIPASQDQVHELYHLVKKAGASLAHEQRDEFVFRIQKGPSIEEYQIIRDELINLQLSAVARIQNGEDLSASEIKLAIKAKMDDERS